MVLTSAQLRELSSEELLEYAVGLGELNLKYEILEKQNIELLEMNSKLEKRLAAVESSIVTESVISVTQNCNDLLIERVKHLEVQVLRNSQYARNRQLEIHNVPAIIPPTVLTQRICETLCLTGEVVTPVCVEKCHRLSNKSSVIIEFTSRKMRDTVLRSRSKLKNHKATLKDLNVEKAVIIDSLSPGYKRLDFLCRKLKKADIINETWFFDGRFFIKEQPNAEKVVISHITYIYNYDRWVFEKVGSIIFSVYLLLFWFSRLPKIHIFIYMHIFFNYYIWAF